MIDILRWIREKVFGEGPPLDRTDPGVLYAPLDPEEAKEFLEEVKVNRPACLAFRVGASQELRDSLGG